MGDSGKTSLAAVFTAAGAPLEMRRFAVPVPVGGEAVVRVRCATLCGSDLHSYFGRRHAPAPSVLGHEMVGDVEAMGPAGVRDYRGRPLAIGDRVTWSMVWSCGECFYCRHGLRPKCERLFKFGHEALTPGRELIGGMAEHCFLPEGTAIFGVPDNVADEAASPANCATATVAAVLRHAGSVEGEVLVVHGAGMLGLTACAMAATSGATQVIVLEPDRERREQALRFGATLALDSGEAAERTLAQVKELSAGRGADVAMEFSGRPESMELGLSLLRMGGRFLAAGATYPSRDVALSAEQMVRRMLRITGVYNYAPEDLETALAFLSGAAGRYPFEELVGAKFPLSEANRAMAYAEAEHPPRVALLP